MRKEIHVNIVTFFNG